MTDFHLFLNERLENSPPLFLKIPPQNVLLFGLQPWLSSHTLPFSSFCPFFCTETLKNPKRKQKHVAGIRLRVVYKDD